MFYAVIRAAGHRIVLGTFSTMEDVARAYGASAWRLERPRRNMNFHDCESLTEAEFLAGAQNLVTTEQRRYPRQLQRHLAIAKADESAMEAWRQAFPAGRHRRGVLIRE
jgi:hypothetical protein